MTLLDASITLIDAAKQLPENKSLERAIKRMEKRVQVLRLRSAKARRRCRHKAWWHAMRSYVGGVIVGTRITAFGCPRCLTNIDFGYFARTAEVDGRGVIKSFDCHKCGRDFTIGMRYDIPA